MMRGKGVMMEKKEKRELVGAATLIGLDLHGLFQS